MDTEKSASMVGLLPRISSMVFNRPMMIQDSKLSQIAQVLSTHRGMELSSVDLELLRSQHGVSSQMNRSKYEIIQGGLALIPVEGTLLHKTAGLDALSGLMSYKEIEGQLRLALDDSSVGQIALMVKSPGGDVQGVFDLAEFIFESRGVKPISAIVDETAASAAYLIAASTSRIFVPQTAVLGSIGVVARLENHSKMLEKIGVDVEYIYAGKKKVLGSPDTPITDEAREEVGAQVKSAYNSFVSAVTRYTGMSDSEVRGTEAGVYVGQAAVRVGLATDQMSVNEAIKTLLKDNKRNMNMSGNDQTASYTEDQLNLKVGEARVVARAEGVNDGIAQGVKSEQERVSAILALDGADKHIALVHKSIANPKFNSEDVKSLMEAMPTLETTAVASLVTNPLEQAMEGVANPDVGVGAGEPLDDLDAMAMRVINS